jgi:hypothetical protein
MKAASFFKLTAILLIGANARPQPVPSADQPAQSEHIPGPHGLEGWTLNDSVPDHPNEKFPMTLVIARNGRILRRFDGSAFVWKWIFWDQGRKVAYESGPFHFSLQCVLADIKTGKELASFDCFHGIHDGAPDWLRTLETAH